MNWTSEQLADFEQMQLAKRLDKAKVIVLDSANGPQKFLVMTKASEIQEDLDAKAVSEMSDEDFAASLAKFPEKARPHNSPIIDEFLELGTNDERKKVERRMMREAGMLPKSQIRKQNPEYQIQAAFVRQINTRHPEILVFSDCAAHVKKTKFQQMRANALSSPKEKWPDVFIAQPSGEYAGLYLEFKAESPFLKDKCVLKKNPHIEAQDETMERLRQRGYLCYFVWTVEMAMDVTEKYLNL